jgi:hypothetical protein
LDLSHEPPTALKISQARKHACVDFTSKRPVFRAGVHIQQGIVPSHKPIAREQGPHAAGRRKIHIHPKSLEVGRFHSISPVAVGLL